MIERKKVFVEDKCLFEIPENCTLTCGDILKIIVEPLLKLDPTTKVRFGKEDYENSIYCYEQIYRDETDVEYNNRLSREDKIQKEQRKLYEELKKKFEL